MTGYKSLVSRAFQFIFNKLLTFCLKERKIITMDLGKFHVRDYGCHL